MATPKRRELPHERENRKVSEYLHKMMEKMNADSIHNLWQKLESQCASLEAEREKYNELEEKLKISTGGQNIGRAFQKISAWKRRAGGSTVTEVYNLDTSFLLKIGGGWDKKIEGKDESSAIASLQKSLGRQQQQAEGIYYRFIERVAELALQEPENERQTYIQAWHDDFVESYNEATIGELFEEYEGRFIGVSFLPKPVTDVPLFEALPLISNWAPKQLYMDLLGLRHDLGTVSKEQFDKWEEVITKQCKDPAEKEQIRRATMRSVLKIAIHRYATATTGAAAPEQEAILDSLLYTEKENPYSVEFNISEQTPLLEYTRLYQQMAGAGK
jgi:hypothetical protein